MNKSPFASVVMPVYNCAKYLEEAIESILAQTFKDFEFIIINDGSTDESPEILNEYANQDSRIKVINQSNSGIVTALNKGISQAKGEWILRMDGDDISLPHRFTVQIEAIGKNPSLVLLGGWCQQINSQGIPLEISKYPSTHDGLVNRLERGLSFFPHPTACFRRDTVLELGGYRSRFLEAEDMDLWLRFINAGEIGCCPSVVTKLRGDKSLMIKLRRVFSCAARICYYHRKAGLSDLSQAEDATWQKFLEWVAKRLEAHGYFQREQAWIDLREIWYGNPQANKMGRAIKSMWKLIHDSSARKALGSRLYPKDIALTLAEESRQFLWI